MPQAQPLTDSILHERGTMFLRFAALMLIKATLNDLTSHDPNRRMIGTQAMMSGELDTPLAIAGIIAGRSAGAMRRRLEERVAEIRQRRGIQ